MFNLPSMLSDKEKKYLYETVKALDIDEDDCILEFGVFLGGSIEPMALGFLEKKMKNTIIGIDAFQCSVTGLFRQYVEEEVAKIGLQHLLIFTNDRLMWFNIAKKNLGGYSNVKLVKIESSQYIHTGEAIALVHMDLPKYYKETAQIMHEILPYLKRKCILVFQDFFYHWSAELIAFVYFLIKQKHVRYLYDASCTLAVENVSLSYNSIEEFSKNYSNYNFVKQLILECILYFENSDFFEPKQSRIETLRLALIQYAKINNDEETARIQNIILKIRNSNHFTRLYEELNALDFDLRKNYENDFKHYE